MDKHSEVAYDTTTIEPLLTLEQVATLLGVRPRRVYELVWHRGLPAVRIGRRLRFRPEDLRAWLERCRIGPPLT